MTVLSDHEIAELVHYGPMDINPYDEDRVQPASYDVILDDTFYVLTRNDPDHPFRFNLDEGIPAGLWQKKECTEIEIAPNSFILGSTVATFDLPDDITLSVEPKSSGARNGLVTDGWGDPGWSGTITLELVNASPYTMVVEAGKSYAQFVFERTGEPANNPYTGRYQGQDGVARSQP